MPDFYYTEQNVYVERDQEQGLYKFGVVLDGAFVVFAVRKLGGVDDDIARAKLAAAETAAQTPPPVETPAETPPVPVAPFSHVPPLPGTS